MFSGTSILDIDAYNCDIHVITYPDIAGINIFTNAANELRVMDIGYDVYIKTCSNVLIIKTRNICKREGLISLIIRTKTQKDTDMEHSETIKMKGHVEFVKTKNDKYTINLIINKKHDETILGLIA